PAVQALSLVRTSITTLQTIGYDGVTDDMTVDEAIAFLENKNANPLISDFEKEARNIEITALKALITDNTQMAAQFAGSDKIGDIKTKLNETAATMETALRSAGVSEAIITTGNVTALDTELGQIESELSMVNMMLTAAQVKVEDLQKAYEELSRGQMEAVAEITKGEAQLESGIAQFESARDEALRNANIDSLVTQSTISGILTAQNFSMPAGYIMLGDERVTVKVGEKFSDLESLENLLLVDMGLDGVEPVYLKDVATVEIKDNSGDSFVKINGNDGIVLSISKSSVASTS
ncbi:MAG: efflux RND transporter permease subunit, partial [Oscillospiraceae bacterium]|nr:efflux RND transporter permease subunit [Oscillospiraceae bacterium]